MNVAKAEMEIKRFILEAPIPRTEEYFIPMNVCGKIIGRGGASIREITNKSNCKIKLNDRIIDAAKDGPQWKDIKEILEPEPNEDWTYKKVVKLTGTETEINSAKVTFIFSVEFRFGMFCFLFN